MVVEYTRYKIDEPRRAAFLDAYRKAAESLRAAKNCLAYELTQRTEDEACFVLPLEWDSEEGHLKEFQTFSARKASSMNSRT